MFIYAIIVYYSVVAMLKLIDDCETALDFAKMILLDTFCLSCSQEQYLYHQSLTTKTKEEDEYHL